MKAPEEIFIAETPDKLIWSDDQEKLKPYINVYCYLRKDVVDETIQTAEDHAYFAGKEKLREELLEWAKAEKEKCSIGLSEYDMGMENGKMENLNGLIDKLNSM